MASAIGGVTSRWRRRHDPGFTVVDVPSREEALEWAAKIAAACRCAQEVREILPEPPGLEQGVPQGRSAHQPEPA